jgi:hypothetical protein
MKQHKSDSAIREIFHFFIYYKIIETIVSIIILIITYKLFPIPFNFFLHLIEQYIKF